MPEGNGWVRKEALVLSELERHNEWLEKISDAQQRILVEIAMLKVKASLWGGLAGAVPVIVYLLVKGS